MENDISYTTEEIAKLLKISKLTVYDLIKKGKLQAYRVGRQMRVDARDLDAYKSRAKGDLPGAAGGAGEAQSPASGSGSAAERRAGVAGSEGAGTAPSTKAAAAGASPAAGAALNAAESRASDAAPTAAGRPLAAGAATGATPAAAGTAETAAYAAAPQPSLFDPAVGAASRPIVITGQDLSLDILATHIERKARTFRPLRSYAGSLDSLISMYHGEADVVSCHLLDGDTGEFNLPYIRRLLVGFPLIVVRLVTRSSGLYVQKGNPLHLQSWQDLARPGLRLVNREKGSGARVLLDEQLRLNRIGTEELAGYRQEELSHLGVAGKVASGEADVGVGIEKAAFTVGIDFIPLIDEQCDLVMLKQPHNLELIDTILNIIRSDAFRNELRSIRGYDLSETGNVIWES